MKLYKEYTSLKRGNHKKEIPSEYEMISDHIFKNFLKSSNSEIKILEIGCGEGDLMQYLKNKFNCKILGIDISKRQVALAREKSLNVINYDIFEYLESFEDQKIYDLIILVDVIEHLPKRRIEDLFIRLSKTLKKNGSVIFKFPNGYSPLSKIYFAADFTHVWLPTSTSLEQILSASGLKLYLTKPLYIKVKSITSIIRFIILIFLDYFCRFLYCIVNGPSYISTICTANIFLIFKKYE